MLRSKRKKISGIIVNRYKGKEYETTPEEIREIYKLPIVSVIPEDEDISIAISEQIPVVFYNPNSIASEEFFRLAAEISGIKYKKKKKIGLF